ncbi:hypothetical protein HO133_007052 [Letharia lupina]|uniref:Uncharacterized protein n=1 Tax=Letharia lupina TaxID=560253 RepID=A0A8H6FI37_9LECA|nr:uncharacterized protein HO133_007052 [Letharia lupina]KAF6228940.1 hypothetical protein HO133_007052 [Letharia lupina]
MGSDGTNGPPSNSLRILVAFEIPASKYNKGPYWEHEYLILKCVPAEASRIYELEDFERVWSIMNRFSAPSSSVVQLPMPQVPMLELPVYPFSRPSKEPAEHNDPSELKKRLLPRDLASMSQVASFGPN